MIDDETALIEVTFESQFELSQILLGIASYNRRNHECLQVFYEPFLNKFEAIIRI